MQDLQTLFNQAIELPDDERMEFLDNACADELEMREELKSLIEIHSGAGRDFLETPALLEADRALLGDQVGPYKLLSLVGIGGMADVYRARRTDGVFRNDVALKLVKRSILSEELAQRFHNERLILSNLKHPNIANLLDGGTTSDGTPYFVMDYIEGLDLLDYVEQHSLAIRDKLKLFVKVCAGVAAAHKHLVVHRDLKPSNILVTSDGEPKLLDFGIAKDISGSNLITSLSPMTPRYASPEQIRGEILGTATDIYSLGVILYELLTGCSPYTTDTPVELIHQISETTPVPMSEKLRAVNRKDCRAVSGDLDRIVMKALHKDQNRRFFSVQQFADDIQRYLTNKPVIARKDSFWYRSSRFLRRNWAMVAVVCFALITVVTATWLQQVRVIEERDVAESERDIAAGERDRQRQTKEFLIGLFEVADPRQTRGNSITARELLDRGLKQIDEGLAQQPEFKSELMLTMGVVYRELGLYDEAQALLQDTLTLRRKYPSKDRLGVAESLNELGSLLQLRGQHEESLALHQDALEIYRRELGESHARVGETYLKLGQVRRLRGEFDLAQELFEKSLAVSRQTLGDEHESTGRSYVFLGIIYWEKGDYARSISLMEKGLEIYIKTLGENHPDVSDAYTKLATSYFKIQDFDRAIVLLEKSLAIRLKVLGSDHYQVAHSYANLANIHTENGNYDQAIAYHTTALDILIRLFGENHSNLGSTYNNLGFSYFKKGEYEPAIRYMEKCASSLTKNFGADYVRLFVPYESLGDVYEAQENHVTAASYYRHAYDLLFENFGDQHPDTIRLLEKLVKAGQVTQ